MAAWPLEMKARELWLHASDDELKQRAQDVRAQWHEPTHATYMVMRIINYTNVCVAQCDYCAFYVLPNEDGGYVLSREDVFAKIDGEKVIVTSPAVKTPVAVRYAWKDDPKANLVNGAGLPASPFRSDAW